MKKLTLTIGSSYLATFPDGNTLTFTFLGNSPEYPDPFIEVEGKRFSFRDKVAIWVSIEELISE